MDIEEQVTQIKIFNFNLNFQNKIRVYYTSFRRPSESLIILKIQNHK